MVGYSHDGASTFARKEGNHVENEALKTFQIALAGTASGHLQELLESAFRYPESWASMEWGKQLEEIQQQVQENCQDAELVASVEPITEPANPDTDPTPSIGDITPQPGKELDKDIECPLPTIPNNIIAPESSRSYQM